MDDIHGAATPSGREQFLRDLSRETDFKGGDGCELVKPHEPLKRLRLALTGAKTRPTPGVLRHRATLDATPLLTTDDTRLYRSCLGALMYYLLDRADAQLENKHSLIALESHHHWRNGSNAKSDTIFAGNARYVECSGICGLL